MKLSRLTPVLIAGALIAATAYAYRGAVNGGPSAPLPSPQDVINLDRRVSMVEQRLSFLESNLTRLQQLVSMPQRAISPSGARDPEVTLLRQEVDILQRQLASLDCAVAKLDERTLTPTAREARRRTGVQSTDPCRLNPEAPVQTLSRP